IYGMDESGFPPSHQGMEQVIGRRGLKIQHKAGSVNHKNVTALVTICADRMTLKPTIIFKGRNFMKSWENGWTDGGLALEWMKKDFDPQTKEKAAGETRVLLMDGHSSHYTADLLEYCLENDIKVIGYPPHCTHALQGLDVVCFVKMKVAWKEEINAFEELHRWSVDKGDFCGVFGRAYILAFTKENIEAAFAATGIHPFDPNVVRPEQMKPAEATSTRSSFPLLQPSPV
ncbi:DDE-domain-containing protein, partial [Tricholoma matsutake]